MLGHASHDGPLAATFCVTGSISEDGTELCLVADVHRGEFVNGQWERHDWPRLLKGDYSFARVGPPVKIAMNDAEAAWYNTPDKIKAFDRTLILACIAPLTTGEWRGFHLYE